MTDAAFVEVKNVSRVFDVSRRWLERVTLRLPRQLLLAAANISFSISRNETFALVGESGSGKSTIARIIVSLIPPSDGDVIIDGRTLADRAKGRTQDRRSAQMIFQDPYASLDPRWRAADIIGEPIRAFALSATRADLDAKVAELLRLVGLDAADGVKFPHEFSGGQRQRIAIARALASQAEFIVCDEPTSALDVSVQAQVLNLMRDLQSRLGLTYLLISHNLAVVRHMATRVGVMYLGRIVEIGPSKELFRKPRHPYTRMLLDAVPRLDAPGTRAVAEGEIPNPLNPPPGCPFHPRCRYANARCRVEMPLLLPADASSVACHAVEERRL